MSSAFSFSTGYYRANESGTVSTMNVVWNGPPPPAVATHSEKLLSAHLWTLFSHLHYCTPLVRLPSTFSSRMTCIRKLCRLMRPTFLTSFTALHSFSAFQWALYLFNFVLMKYHLSTFPEPELNFLIAWSLFGFLRHVRVVASNEYHTWRFSFLSL